MYKVLLSREAERFLDRCQKPVARKLYRCFAALERGPRDGNNVKALTSPLSGAYRYRVGDWRVVYLVNDDDSTVFVVTIAHRSDVYS